MDLLKQIIILLLATTALSSCKVPQTLAVSDVKCLGHRGNTAANVFENSMPALLSAYNLGGDGSEFDVIHTKDGVPIVFHDKTLERLTKSRIGKNCKSHQNIKDLTFSDINENCILNSGDEIPTLEDVLSTFQPTDFNLLIEFKDHISSSTKNLIQKYYANKQDNIQSIISLPYYLLDPLRYKDFPTDLLVFEAMYFSGMEFSTDGVDVRIISKENIEKLQYLGKKISLHVLNDRESITNAFQVKANFITTNDLELCVQIKQELI